MYVIMLCPFFVVIMHKPLYNFSFPHTHTHSLLFSSAPRSIACMRKVPTYNSAPNFFSGSVFPPTTSACIFTAPVLKRMSCHLLCVVTFFLFLYIHTLHTYIHTVYINCTAGCSRHSLSALSSLVQSGPVYLTKKMEPRYLLAYCFFFVGKEEKKDCCGGGRGEARRGEGRGGWRIWGGNFFEAMVGGR